MCDVAKPPVDTVDLCAKGSMQEQSSDTPKNRRTLKQPVGIHGMSGRPVREQWLKFADELATSVIKLLSYFFSGRSKHFKGLPVSRQDVFPLGKKVQHIWVLTLSAIAYLLTYVDLCGPIW